MQNQSVIKNWSAALLLLLFTFSITPKQFLHDLIVRHTDDYATASHDRQQNLHKVGFRCDCTDLVVQVPYLVQPDFELQHPILSHVISYQCFSSGYQSAETIFSSLRGPPASHHS